jgi:hypothetical protein
MRLAEIEQELLVSYDPTVIKDLVQKVASKAGTQTVGLSDLVCDHFNRVSSTFYSNM